MELSIVSLKSTKENEMKDKGRMKQDEENLVSSLTEILEKLNKFSNTTEDEKLKNEADAIIITVSSLLNNLKNS